MSFNTIVSTKHVCQQSMSLNKAYLDKACIPGVACAVAAAAVAAAKCAYAIGAANITDDVRCEM